MSTSSETLWKLGSGSSGGGAAAAAEAGRPTAAVATHATAPTTRAIVMVPLRPIEPDDADHRRGPRRFDIHRAAREPLADRPRKGHAVVHETGVHGGPSPRVVGAVAVVAFVFGSVVLLTELPS